MMLYFRQKATIPSEMTVLALSVTIGFYELFPWLQSVLHIYLDACLL